MVDGGADVLAVLTRRIDLLEELSSGPLYKRDLLDRVESSRSTIDRAIRELEAVGFVERTAGGFVATRTGQLAGARYRRFCADQRTILDARPVLQTVPGDWKPPLTLLLEGQVQHGGCVSELVELLAEMLRTVSTCRIALPALLDSRILRLCHARSVSEERPIELLAPRSELAGVAREFPQLWRELVDSQSFTARARSVPAGLITASGPDSGSRVLLVSPAAGEIDGFVRSTDPAAIAWAQSQYESLAEGSEPVAQELIRQSPPVELPSLTGRQLPTTLQRQGFVRYDSGGADQFDPKRGRSGLDRGLLPSVFDQLRTGNDVAVLGSPQRASRVCRSIATQWGDDESGPVFYRERSDGHPFEAVAVLEALLDQVARPVLVVVEDAMQPAANAVFEVMRSFSGRGDVVFLLATTEAEWADPTSFPIDARLAAFRREAVETVSLDSA